MSRTLEYESSLALSQSAIKDIHDEEWAYYHAKYIAKTVPRKEKKAFDLGHFLHILVLEPHKIDRCVMIPDSALNADGHKKGKPWTDFAAANADKLLFKKDEYDNLLKAFEAVKRHPAGKQLLDMPGEVEKPLSWKYETSSGVVVDAKGIVDKLCPRMIIDVKSSREINPKKFQRQAEDLLYDVQATWYASAIEGIEYFTFLAVEITPPFRVRAYPVPDSWYISGRAIIDPICEEWDRRMKENDWLDECDKNYTVLEKMRWR